MSFVSTSVSYTHLDVYKRQVHGRFKGTVAVEGTSLVVNGKKVRLTAVKDPAELKWDEIGADIVVDATGLFLTTESCQKHITAGAKKVIQSAPSKDDTPMFVFGVNDLSLIHI